MNKKFRINLILCISFFICTFIYSVCSADTVREISITNNVTEDVVWGGKGIVYALENDIQIAPNVNVNILPGTKINGNGHNLIFYGSISANGTSELPINIQKLGLVGRSIEGGNFSLKMSNVQMNEGALLPPTGHEQHGEISIKSCVFENVGNAGNYTYIWYPVSDVEITGNLFINCGTISIGSTNGVLIEYNTFFGDAIGYYKSYILCWANYGAAASIKNNNFMKDTVAVKISDSGRANASENYWGAVNANKIADRIWDYNDDFSLATVCYNPFLESAPEYCPKYIEPTPVQTATPTPTPEHSHLPYLKETVIKATTTENGRIREICTSCGQIVSEQTIYYPKTIKLSANTYTYNGKVQRPTVSVTGSDGKAISPEYYTVTYSSGCKNAGTYSGKITFKGNYSGEVTKSFTIKKANQTISASNKIITLGAKSFSLNAKLTKGNGKLTYKSSNTSVATVSSTGKVTIKGVGKTTITITASATTNYNKASKTVTVTVNPNGTSITSIKNSSSKSLTVQWKRNSSVTGYQIRYSTSSTFKSAKTVTVKKNSTLKTTISKLTKGKTYYVQIRTYKTVSGKNYYSGWSAAKKLKITK